MQHLKLKDLAARLSLLAVLGATSSVACAETGDSLERAALPNLRAEQAVMMDIDHAGDRLVAVGEQGIVLLSDDNGKRWRQAGVPVSVALTNVAFPTSSSGWAVGHSGVILHSGDRGETWVRQLDGRQAAEIELATAQAENDGSSLAQRRLRNAQFLVKDGPDKPFLDVLFLDELRGWVIGAYGLIFATDDGGKTWRSLSGHTENSSSLHLYSIEAQGGSIYIVGEQGLMLRSKDEGRSFVSVDSPYHGSFFGIGAADGGVILAYGLRGNSFRNNGADQGWVGVDMGQEVSLTADVTLSDGSLLLADETGRVLRSADGARSFKPLPITTHGYLSGLVQAADGALVVAGMRGVSRIELDHLSMESKP